MNSNKGITLTSLAIYIIGIVIVISILGTITDFFYKNVNQAIIKDNFSEQYARFTTFLLNDVNSGNVNTVATSSGSQNDYISIMLNDGTIHQYVFDDEQIYYIEIKNSTTTKIITMCTKVQKLSANQIFSYDSQTKQIDVRFSINQKKYSDTYFIA